MTPTVKSFLAFFTLWQEAVLPAVDYDRGPLDAKEALPIAVPQIRGRVTPFWPWYLPPRSR